MISFAIIPIDRIVLSQKFRHKTVSGFAVRCRNLWLLCRTQSSMLTMKAWRISRSRSWRIGLTRVQIRECSGGSWCKISLSWPLIRCVAHMDPECVDQADILVNDPLKIWFDLKDDSNVPTWGFLTDLYVYIRWGNRWMAWIDVVIINRRGWNKFGLCDRWRQ